MKTFNALLSASVFVLLLISQALAAPPGGHLNITQVLVDNPNDPASIMISGEDFSFGPGPLVVTLGNASLTVVEVVDVTPTDTMIEALLPAGLPSGDYLLTVSMGSGESQNDEYDLTIGAAGPQGEQGPPGADGAAGAGGVDGTQGEKGDKGDPGKIGPAGEDGADGAPGLPGQSVVAVSLDIGDTNCPHGGSKFTAVNGVTYVCDGAPGIEGEDGTDGQPGNFALAGLSCTNGEFLKGFDSAGQLVCAAINGGAEPIGPTLPPPSVEGCDLAGMDIADAFVCANNNIRAQAPNAVPPLDSISWSAELASSAQTIAEILAADMCSIGNNADGLAPNAARLVVRMQDATTATGAVAAVELFAGERQFYNELTGECTQEVASFGCFHYKAIVNRQLSEIGCGAAACDIATSNSGIGICDYLPGPPISEVPVY